MRQEEANDTVDVLHRCTGSRGMYLFENDRNQSEEHDRRKEIHQRKGIVLKSRVEADDRGQSVREQDAART